MISDMAAILQARSVSLVTRATGSSVSPRVGASPKALTTVSVDDFGATR